jgi:hypothetical protein
MFETRVSSITFIQYYFILGATMSKAIKELSMCEK